MLSKLCVLLLLLTYVFSFNSYAVGTKEDCSLLVERILLEKNDASYHDQDPLSGAKLVETARGTLEKSSKGMKYIDSLVDQKSYKDIKPAKMAEGFRKATPTGLNMLDHQLFRAEESVVKSSTMGDFVSMRVDLTYKGKLLPSNVGFLKRLFGDNLSRRKKSLVREDAEAVLIFLHGGGTSTTGHHVAASMANHFENYKVDVISIDLPWHGEGPQEFFTDGRETLEWLREFIKTYLAPSGKPIILSGHSMGGMVTDLYMRAYGKDDNLVQGLIALSPAVDPLPGAATRIDRMRASKQMWADIANSKDNVLAELDGDFIENILLNGKSSPMGSQYANIIGSSQNFEVPSHQGEGYLPTLWIWGEQDYLLRGGWNRMIDDYIRPLKNSEIKMYGERVSDQGRKVRIGHLIFSHFRPGTKEYEAQGDMRLFIEKIINKKLVYTKLKSSKVDVFENIMKEYSTNFAFKEFAERYAFSYKSVINFEKMKELNSKIKALSKKENSLKSSEKKTKEVLKRDIQKLSAIRRGEYVPTGKEGDEGRKWLMKEAKMNDLLIVKKEAFAGINGRIDEDNLLLSAAKSEVQSQVLLLEKNGDKLFTQLSLELKEARKGLDWAASESSRRTNLILEKAYAKGEATPEDLKPSPEDYQFFKEFQTLYFKNYQVAKANLEDSLLLASKNGQFNEELRLAAERLSYLEESLARTTEASRLLRNLIVNIDTERALLNRKVVEKYNSDLFGYKEIFLKDILELDFSEWSKYNKALQEALRSWKTSWRYR